jgi:hypothetical protein
MKKVFTTTLFLLGVVAFSVAQAPDFRQFLNQFPKASLPYNLGCEALTAQIEKTGVPGKTARLSWKYFDFLPELERSAQFSSMPVQPEPVASFETKKYYAVLYNIARGNSRNSKTYTISVYDKRGNYIGSHFIAGVNKNNLTAATIDATLNVEVHAFQIQWSEKQSGATQITDLRKTDSTRFALNTEGNPDQIEWNIRKLVPATAGTMAKSK